MYAHNTPTSASDTLFTPVTCPLVPKRFLWWKWQEHSHEFRTVSEWSEPGWYSTMFYTEKLCVKCWATHIDVDEQSGP